MSSGDQQAPLAAPPADTPFVCPLCDTPLVKVAGGVVCAQRHRFDRAREGYLNLLPAHHRRTRTPGDTATMVAHRDAFLRAGHYAAVADAINAVVIARQPALVADLGCGTGYFSLAAPAAVVGIDIAKPAIKRAAARARQSSAAGKRARDYAVASVRRPPIAAASVDLALVAMAPCDATATKSLLVDGGEVLRIAPASDHLTELKTALFGSARAQRSANPLAGFKCFAQVEIRNLVTLTAVDIAHLIGMTPLAWRSPQARQEAVLKTAQLNVQTAFVLERFRAT